MTMNGLKAFKEVALTREQLKNVKGGRTTSYDCVDSNGQSVIVSVGGGSLEELFEVIDARGDIGGCEVEPIG